MWKKEQVCLNTATQENSNTNLHVGRRKLTQMFPNLMIVDMVAKVKNQIMSTLNDVEIKSESRYA